MRLAVAAAAAGVLMAWGVQSSRRENSHRGFRYPWRVEIPTKAEKRRIAANKGKWWSGARPVDGGPKAK